MTHKNKLREASDPYAVIAAMTGLRQTAVQSYLVDNDIDVERLTQDLVDGKVKPMDISTAVSGNTNNRYSMAIKKNYSESTVKKIKSTLKKIIREEVTKVIRLKENTTPIKEASSPRYSVTYYATVGEHGEAKSFGDFKSALREALKFQKQKDSEGSPLMEGLEYLGVEPSHGGLEFAVVFVQESYIKHVDSDQNFASPADRTAFMTAAKKCLQTGKPAIGKFTEEVKESRLKESSTKVDNNTLKQYIGTALWSTTEGDDGNLDDKYSIKDLAPQTIKAAKTDLESFVADLENEGLLEPYLEEFDMTDLAHDFWLTRNGHGAGFWDRSYSNDSEEGDLGDKLTKVAKEYKGQDWYAGDDGKIYIMGKE